MRGIFALSACDILPPRIFAESQIPLDVLLDITAYIKRYEILLRVFRKRLSISHPYLGSIFASLKTAGQIHAH